MKAEGKRRRVDRGFFTAETQRRRGAKGWEKD